MKILDYNVIASGSRGNAVRIENIMVDCGIPFKKMEDDLYKVDTLLITHSHSDHLKPSTLKSIRDWFPRITVYANYYVAYQYKVDRIIGTAAITLPKKRVIYPVEGLHDIPVTYFFIKIRDMNILYATDTCRIDNPMEMPLDYVFLESNYDEVKLKTLAKEYRHHGYDPTVSSHRHLSTQRCKEFYYVWRRSEDSPLIELHKSARFY